jgi:diacylglycerol kinase (ATP)
MTAFLHSRIRSFYNAFRGGWYVVRTQRNAWIHVAVVLLVVLLSFWLRLDLRDWAVIVLTITIVFVAEFLNTAVEVVVDLASPRQHPLARVAKDVGAGAVLLAAIAAVLIGLLILGPPLSARVFTFLASR